MVSHREIAEKFVNGCKKAKGSRMFIKGCAVYSYGVHFPIAVRLSGDVFYFNKDRYSKSTSAHQNYVKRAILDKGFDVLDIIEKSTGQLQDVIDDIKDDTQDKNCTCETKKDCPEHERFYVPKVV